MTATKSSSVKAPMTQVRMVTQVLSVTPFRPTGPSAEEVTILCRPKMSAPEEPVPPPSDTPVAPVAPVPPVPPVAPPPPPLPAKASVEIPLVRRPAALEDLPQIAAIEQKAGGRSITDKIAKVGRGSAGHASEE